MGIIFIEHGLDKEVYYRCNRCDIPFFKIDDMSIATGHCAQGLTYIFNYAVNLLISTATTHVQMFYGDDMMFLLDTDPLENSEIKDANYVNCKRCMNHLGWKLDSEQFIILKNSIY